MRTSLLAAILVLAGCSLPNPPSEAVRGAVSRVRVSVAFERSKVDHLVPPDGAGAGLLRGFVLGVFRTGLATVVLGATVPGGAVVGILSGVVFIPAGAVGGIITYVDPSELRAAGAALEEALDRCGLREGLARELSLRLKEEARREVVPDLPGAAADARLEVTVTALKLHRTFHFYSVDPQLYLQAELTAELRRRSDGHLLHRVALSWERPSERRRYVEWAAGGAAPFAASLAVFQAEAAEKIVDELFLLRLPGGAP